jgi:hypothetical protein
MFIDKTCLYRPRENICCCSNIGRCITRMDLYGTLLLDYHVLKGLEKTHAL